MPINMSHRWPPSEASRLGFFVLVILGFLIAPAVWAGELLVHPEGRIGSLPRLTTGPSGLLMSWVHDGADGTARLKFAHWKGEGWGAPFEVVRGDDWFVNWADFPSVVEIAPGHLAAHWLQEEGPDTYAYGVRIAQSRDKGSTWSKPLVPHRDGTLTEHGFVTLLPWGEDQMLATWLDGRETAGHDGPAGHGHGAGGNMTLRVAVIGAEGSISGELRLDERTCECCSTDAVLIGDGALIAYRDRSESEVRDISVVRWVDGGWTSPVTPHADGWEVPGCPVNGPALSARGQRVALAWFTAADDQPTVQVSFSDDGGASFDQAIRVDEGVPEGRVDVVLLDDGSAAVTWLDFEKAEIQWRRVARDGERDAVHVVAASSAARASGFPQIAVIGDLLVFAWTEIGETPHVRTATRALPALGR